MYVSGYSDRFTMAGPYTCIGDKVANSRGASSADKAVMAQTLYEDDSGYQILAVNRYPVQSPAQLPAGSSAAKFVTEVISKRKIKVAVMDWTAWSKFLFSEGKPQFTVANFTCRTLPDYNSPCQIQSASQITKDIVAGKIQPLSPAQVNQAVLDYVTDALKAGDDPELTKELLDKTFSR